MWNRVIFALLLSTSAQLNAQTFNGYPFTQDCSGHEAGYDWAEENDIEDTDDCGGNSASFIEGCESYVEENYDEEEADDDYGY